MSLPGESFDFLQSLLSAPSVSGFEQPAARIVRQRMEPFADAITTDFHGNTIVALNADAKMRVMLAGHVDQIGLMIRHVTDDGFLYFSAVGGVDLAVLPGSRVTVHGPGGPVEGVIGRKPIHLMKPDEKNGSKLEPHDLWIDIGATDQAAAMQLVNIGDPVTYMLGVTRLGPDLIAGAGLDDKVGAFVVMEALRLCHTRRGELKCGVFAVATVQEEIGLRGAHTSAFGIEPQAGIAVDVTHATDNPGAEKKKVGDVSLGKGPTIHLGPNINPVLGNLLLETAAAKKHLHQRQAAPGATGTDANPIQLSRGGVAAALLGIPNRYMHTQVEVVSLTDLEHAAALLADTLLSITSDTDFRPR